MKLLERVRRAWAAAQGGGVPPMETVSFGRAFTGASDDLSEITYFTCLKTLSESLGKMPCHLIRTDKTRVNQHETLRFLLIEPNDGMTPIQFFTALEYERNHHGNGYAYIARDAYGSVTGLYVLNPCYMQVWINNTKRFTERKYFYQYVDPLTARAEWIAPGDLIHVKSWITDKSGLVGKSVREILASNMAGSKAAQEFLNELYRKGLTANAVVKYVGDLSRKEQETMLRRIQEQAKVNNMVSLPIGTDIQALDLKLADSQFYELKKYNSLQIAAAFGVNPDHLNDYSKSSYNNSAMQNLQFYVHTLLYNLTQYEQELNRKLLTRREQEEGMHYKFNVWNILRGDPSQQADILQKMVQSAIYSPNEAREKLDAPPCDGGNVHMVNGSYVRLEEIGMAYTLKGGEQND